MLKFIVLSLILLLSITAVSENHVYYYENKNSVITGTIKMEEIHDPPGYNKGEIIYPYMLYLDVPINVLPSVQKGFKNKTDVNLIPEYNVTKIQLKYDSLVMNLKNYNDKKVIITGVLHHSDSLYFYTNVFISITNIQIVE
ncbi:MAG: hypothetical protein KBF12_08750 [Sebaldella sp.]|nr:hypothetical protein [Sebaldella sp.]